MSDVSDDEPESVRDQTPPPASRKSAHAASHRKSNVAHSPEGGSVAGTDTPAANGKKGPNNALFNGPKVKHLKKADGIPLWRRDIQYTFLDLIFTDKQKVFTNYYDKTKGHTFCEIYLTAMARSSKTSRILREKLIAGESNSRAMAMVCLLVNLGRINTTLNFFLEMKAQLRTYHSIPSLQARGDSDPHAYKQLQDAPRLKSILKGACEDEANQPSSIEDLKSKAVPRTNPICAVFLLAQFAAKVTDKHFPISVDFFDLVMKTSISAASRARAFLWLMWYYLESDFTEESLLQNPFGKGAVAEDGTHSLVPEFEFYTEEQAKLEDVDTPEEVAFGEKMQEERKRYIADGSIGAPGTNKRGKKARELLDEDGSRVGSPASVQATPYEKSTGKRGGGIRSSGRAGRKSYSLAGDYESDAATRSPSPDFRGRKHLLNGGESDGSPGPAKRRMKGQAGGRIILSTSKRPQTSHQVALQENRKERIKHATDKIIRAGQAKFKNVRLREGNLKRAAKRLEVIDCLYDTEDEDMDMAAYKRDREKYTFDFDANGKLFFKDELAKKEKARQNGENVDPATANSSNNLKATITKEDPDSSDVDMDDVPDKDSDDDNDETDSDVPLASHSQHNLSPALHRRPQTSPHPNGATSSHSLPTHPLAISTSAPSSRKIYGNGSYYPGPAGLMPLADEPDDLGEEINARAAAFRRAARRYVRSVERDGKRTEEVVVRGQEEEVGEDLGEEEDSAEETEEEIDYAMGDEDEGDETIVAGED